MPSTSPGRKPSTGNALQDVEQRDHHALGATVVGRDRAVDEREDQRQHVRGDAARQSDSSVYFGKAHSDRSMSIAGRSGAAQRRASATVPADQRRQNRRGSAPSTASSTALRLRGATLVGLSSPCATVARRVTSPQARDGAALRDRGRRPVSRDRSRAARHSVPSRRSSRTAPRTARPASCITKSSSDDVRRQASRRAPGGAAPRASRRWEWRAAGDGRCACARWHRHRRARARPRSARLPVSGVSTRPRSSAAFTARIAWPMSSRNCEASSKRSMPSAVVVNHLEETDDLADRDGRHWLHAGGRRLARRSFVGQMNLGDDGVDLVDAARERRGSRYSRGCGSGFSRTRRIDPGFDARTTMRSPRNTASSIRWVISSMLFKPDGRRATRARRPPSAAPRRSARRAPRTARPCTGARARRRERARSRRAASCRPRAPSDTPPRILRDRRGRWRAECAPPPRRFASPLRWRPTRTFSATVSQG